MTQALRAKTSKRNRKELHIPLAALESKGRKVGAGAGSWVTDIAELRQQIMLCWQCDPKFKGSASRYGYHRDKKWTKLAGGVVGKCDGCREGGPGRQMYVHESFFGVTYDP